MNTVWTLDLTTSVEAQIKKHLNLSLIETEAFRNSAKYLEILDAANDGWWKTVENMLSEEGIRDNGARF